MISLNSAAVILPQRKAYPAWHYNYDNIHLAIQKFNREYSIVLFMRFTRSILDQYKINTDVAKFLKKIEKSLGKNEYDYHNVAGLYKKTAQSSLLITAILT